MSEVKGNAQEQTPAQVESNIKDFNVSTGEITVLENLTALPTVLTIRKLLNIHQAVKNLALLKKTVTISSKYWNCEEKGKTVKAIFMGYKTIMVKSEKYKTIADVPQENRHKFSINDDGVVRTTLECIEFATESDTYILGAITAVQPFKLGNVQTETPFQITYEGKSGKTKIFDVKIFVDADVYETADVEDLDADDLE